MSKTVKGMIIREYQKRFEGTSDAALISIRGVASNDANKLRKTLRGKKIRVTVVRNSLAKRAFEGTGLAGLVPMLQGSNALAYGGQSVIEVAREIVKMLAEFPHLELRGAILDGQIFEGVKGVKELSKFPTREEALSQAVTIILGPARTLMAQVKGPGATVAGIIKSIETKLEKNEKIAKVA